MRGAAHCWLSWGTAFVSEVIPLSSLMAIRTGGFQPGPLLNETAVTVPVQVLGSSCSLPGVPRGGTAGAQGTPTASFRR